MTFSSHPCCTPLMWLALMTAPPKPRKATGNAQENVPPQPNTSSQVRANASQEDISQVQFKKIAPSCNYLNLFLTKVSLKRVSELFSCELDPCTTILINNHNFPRVTPVLQPPVVEMAAPATRPRKPCLWQQKNMPKMRW